MRRRTIILVVVAGLAATACAVVAGNLTDSADDETAQTSSAPPGSNGGSQASDPTDSAGGTVPRAYTLDEALETDAEGPLAVTGLLIDDGSGWRLCSLVAESYPPQCGGTSMPVEGVVPGDYPVQRASGIRWVDGATIVGQFRDGILVVTGSAASS